MLHDVPKYVNYQGYKSVVGQLTNDMFGTINYEKLLIYLTIEYLLT